MIKSLTFSTFALAISVGAFAAPLPAPPMEVYTPPAGETCDGETLQLYFPAGTTALTPASRAILKAAQARLEDCIVGQVSLSATAADARSDAEADALATARIETVTAALDDYTLTGMHVSADTAPRNQTGSKWTPMDRKVEIRLAAWSPEIS